VGGAEHRVDAAALGCVRGLREGRKAQAEEGDECNLSHTLKLEEVYL
jgi:hypothetical protein